MVSMTISMVIKKYSKKRRETRIYDNTTRILRRLSIQSEFGKTN